MKFTVNRDALLKPLTIVAGAVERRQTMPILANLLVKVKGKKLQLTGTDLEVELSGTVELPESAEQNGEVTIPARKLLDICKSLPAACDIVLSLDDGRAVVKSGRSRFTLATLPSSDFPSVQKDKSSFAITLEQNAFASLIDRTAFSMAQQDVRYYLNGMLWEIGGDHLKAVSTDGHRLAIAEVKLSEKIKGRKQQFIVPRKGIIELSRLLERDDSTITLEFGDNHIRAQANDLIFVSKLVDGKFPDYERVLPKGGDKEMIADREALRAALGRTAILSNEKFRGIRFTLASEQVNIQANNPEQEEALEEVSVDYQGDSVEMGFNVSYLIDVLGVLSGDTVKFTLSDSNSSALIEDGSGTDNALYVVMPMRL